MENSPTLGAFQIGRVRIDLLTFEGALSAIERLVDSGKGGAVYTPNVDHVVVRGITVRLRTDLLNCRREFVFLAAGQHNRRAEPRQLTRDREPDAGRAAGDDSHTICERFCRKHCGADNITRLHL